MEERDPQSREYRLQRTARRSRWKTTTAQKLSILPVKGYKIQAFPRSFSLWVERKVFTVYTCCDCMVIFWWGCPLGGFKQNSGFSLVQDREILLNSQLSMKIYNSTSLWSRKVPGEEVFRYPLLVVKWGGGVCIKLVVLWTRTAVLWQNRCDTINLYLLKTPKRHTDLYKQGWRLYITEKVSSEKLNNIQRINRGKKEYFVKIVERYNVMKWY